MQLQIDIMSIQDLVAKDRLEDALQSIIVIARKENSKQTLKDALALSSELYRINNAVRQGRVGWEIECQTKQRVCCKTLDLLNDFQ